MDAGNGASGLALAEAASRWRDLNSRVKTAVILVVVALFCVWVGGVTLLLLTGAACLLLAAEWVTLCGYGPLHLAGFWLVTVTLVALICGGEGAPVLGLAVVLVGAAGAALFGDARGLSLQSGTARDRHPPARPGDLPERGSRGLDNPGHDVESRRANARLNLVFGFPYLGFAAVALPWLRADPAVGLANTLFVLAIIWSSDIGAYMIGRMVGGPKLAPAISPGKTWSGAAGGLFSAVLAGFAVAACFSSGFSASRVAIVAIGLGLVSQAGDLLESALKRRFGVKDSGRIIPGHGGMLDRLDALLAVAPVAALLAFSVGRGVVLWR